MKRYRATIRSATERAGGGAKRHRCCRQRGGRRIRGRSIRGCRGMHVVMVPVVDLRRQIVVEGDRQDELAMNNAEQRLAEAKRK